MSAVSLETMQRDELVMSVAQAVALANEAALTQGIDPGRSLITITEEGTISSRLWHVHYGPRDYVGRRGGDLTVIVDEQNAVVQGIIRGQ